MHFRLGVAVCVLALFGGSLRAWGPHTEITAAGLRVLPEGKMSQKYFGDDFMRISRDYCWMGDWQEAVRPDHYADDYLLFPKNPRHLSHMHPEVRKTFAPFFKRALQAIRTESPQNAARWVGSLLHFLQDSGSPPHTTGIGGDLHGKMEQWVDESKLTIDGYEPKLLGETEDEALRGFEDRMASLHDFSKVRAEKLKPLVEKLDKRENQTLELECALEVARATADTIHTLFILGRKEPSTPGATLEGKLNYTPPVNYPAVPAKIIIQGTDFSTTADRRGEFRLRNLPPGKYSVWIVATGYDVQELKGVALESGKVTSLEPLLKPDTAAGNLVRNSRFTLKWVLPDQPDGWTRERAKTSRWASALIRVPIGQACRVRVEWADNSRVPVSVRWRVNPATTAGSREVALDLERTPIDLTPDPDLKPFEKGCLYLELLLHTDRSPEELFRHVAVTFTRK